MYQVQHTHSSLISIRQERLNSCGQTFIQVYKDEGKILTFIKVWHLKGLFFKSGGNVLGTKYWYFMEYIYLKMLI